MRTQTLGGGALVTTRLGYGCMRIAGTMERARFTPEMEARGRAAVIAAYEAGYTHFDHADIYGNGLCEEVFGRVLREVSGMRERVLVATKCGIRWADEPVAGDPHRWDFSRQHILWSCERSLERLGVERIDLFMLHRPDYLMQPDEVAEAFGRLHAQGKVREFGVSNFRPATVDLLRRVCPMPLVAHQVEVHAARLDTLEDGTLEQCMATGMTPVSWSPLGRGLLGDGGEPAPDDPRAATLRGLLATLDRVAADHGVSRSVVSLAWLLRHPAGIVPIVGSVRPERIREAVRADSLELTREQWYAILTASRGTRLP